MTFLVVSQHREREFVVKFSAMEIYNEAVRDLLNANATSLRLLDDPEVNLVAYFPCSVVTCDFLALVLLNG